ncbi:putative DNA damage-regulated autophagy modulator protein [Naja naja]|nr:putative DNA damage-regulated autophagy modulator protein [Naja naja]
MTGITRLRGSNAGKPLASTNDDGVIYSQAPPCKEDSCFLCCSGRPEAADELLVKEVKQEQKNLFILVFESVDHFEMWWFQQGLSFLPSALVILSSAACVFPYVIGVLLHHVDPLVPYISDIGTTPPERSLFGIMLCFTSLLSIATMYVRYKQVSALNPEEPKILRLNKAGLVIGMVSCFGICIVANFQKNIVYVIHAFGASLTFGIGIIYILVQTIISYKMQPQIHGKDIFWIRFTMLLWCIISLVTSILCGFHNVVFYKNRYSLMIKVAICTLILIRLIGSDYLTRQRWNPQEKGCTFHIIATVSEWSLFFTFVSFFLTFIRDFQKISLHVEIRLFGPNLYHTQEQLLEDDQGTPITGSI